MTQIGRSRASITVPVSAWSSDAPSAEVTLGWAARTHIGLVRGANEDSYLAKSPLFAVADGMGGHAAGEVASDAVVSRLSVAATGATIGPEEIDRALRDAVADIARQPGRADRGTGTTVTGIALTAVAGEPYWSVFNIGDSRVYLCVQGSFLQLTVDHSIVQELVDAGLITRDEADVHPHSNVITRAVGFHEAPIPDYRLVPVIAGSRLLICSDGLTKELTDAGLEHVLAESASAQDAADRLLEAALENGARDNVTAIVVDVLAVSGESLAIDGL
ncbi:MULTISPECIES: PP2C family protein-serine/threonine phosphatase [unclassified Rathayibacter]|uniref:PP2C family protein-serine/threonine phosphatase n=1 Tax=unclassified Rathayibacter TaxID=2609250 RepID=UPI00188B33A3|nr:MULTISPECIES: protein phosphatase 2C domain-containing protein [unclassified Rathayibacter]MBF4461911.1 serine/threonine-protein phosphatase [Rathayibacter sp. VKM Ac-2879]MBF4504046.1 serine/threonine-protein phosphatase [Rathayibacter sp. VKM Ac-2878]